MSKIISTLLFIFLSCASIIDTQAQVDGSLKLGLAGYQGDIHCRTDDNIGLLDQLKASFGLGARFPISQSLGLRAEGTYFHLTADEDNFANVGHNQRGWEFENKFIELGAMLDYEFLRNKRFGENGQFTKGLTPLVFAGLGVIFNNPEVDFKGLNPAGLSTDLDKGDNIRLTLPVGLGLKYYISEGFALALESGVRLPISDYYDGVSLAASPDGKDAFGFGGLKGYFRLGKKADRDKDGVADKVDLCPDVAGLEARGGCPDSDLDGIVDSEDNCPQVAGLAKFMGCPDTDNDGIIDSKDDCPNTVGTAKTNGCPDTDGDGVANQLDACPKVAGLAALKGCPDADGDGIADANDKCPNQAGLTSNNGCPPTDADNDGIVDTVDGCPNAAGPKSTNGCPDRDGDNIADKNDSCPDLAGNTANGCPNVTTTTSSTKNSGTVNTNTVDTDLTMAPYRIQDKINIIAQDVKFPSGSTRLTTTAISSLKDIATIMRANPSLNLNINGYTDSQGNDAANQQLSANRAKASHDYLVSQGIDPSRLNYRGYGEANPIASNTTESGRIRNRRVEFILTDSTGRQLVKQGTGYSGNVNDSCSGHPIFNLPTYKSPRVLSRLGTNPEFGNSHALDPTEFYQKLRKAYNTNERDRVFLDGIFRAMGYSSFNEATPDLFSEAVLPYGTVGNIGYSVNHRTLYAKLNVKSDRDLQAFRIRSANGCDIHFMKTCGNHMFF